MSVADSTCKKSEGQFFRQKQRNQPFSRQSCAAQHCGTLCPPLPLSCSLHQDGGDKRQRGCRSSSAHQTSPSSITRSTPCNSPGFRCHHGTDLSPKQPEGEGMMVSSDCLGSDCQSPPLGFQNRHRALQASSITRWNNCHFPLSCVVLCL